jgi:hypothetical protein
MLESESCFEFIETIKGGISGLTCNTILLILCIHSFLSQILTSKQEEINFIVFTPLTF